LLARIGHAAQEKTRATEAVLDRKEESLRGFCQKPWWQPIQFFIVAISAAFG